MVKEKNSVLWQKRKNLHWSIVLEELRKSASQDSNLAIVKATNIASSRDICISQTLLKGGNEWPKHGVDKSWTRRLEIRIKRRAQNVTALLEVGKASHVPRQSKINLLDMDASLPREAKRSSKARFDRRCIWLFIYKMSEYRTVSTLTIDETKVSSCKIFYYYTHILYL